MFPIAESSYLFTLIYISLNYLGAGPSFQLFFVDSNFVELSLLLLNLSIIIVWTVLERAIVCIN